VLVRGSFVPELAIVKANVVRYAPSGLRIKLARITLTWVSICLRKRKEESLKLFGIEVANRKSGKNRYLALMPLGGRETTQAILLSISLQERCTREQNASFVTRTIVSCTSQIKAVNIEDLMLMIGLLFVFPVINLLTYLRNPRTAKIKAVLF